MAALAMRSRRGRRAGGGGRSLAPLLFLAPALIFLVVWIVYPTVWTIVRSLFDRDGSNFVGLSNYKEIFTTETLQTAIKNNVLWVAVVPALVTAIGLIFAVLTERVRWSTAFKTVVFMPMAISLFAAGVIWHIMDEKDPAQGTINASLKVVHDAVAGGGVLTAAQGSSPTVRRVGQKRLRARDAAESRLDGARRTDRDPAGRAAERRAAGGHAAGEIGRDRRHGLA